MRVGHFLFGLRSRSQFLKQPALLSMELWRMSQVFCGRGDDQEAVSTQVRRCRLSDSHPSDSHHHLTVMNDLSNNCTIVNCISKSLLSYVDHFFCFMNLLHVEEMSLCPYPLGCCVGYSRANDAACKASVEIVCHHEKIFRCHFRCVESPPNAGRTPCL